MKKFSGKWLEFIIKNSNNSTDYTFCNLLLDDWFHLFFLKWFLTCEHFDPCNAFCVDVFGYCPTATFGRFQQHPHPSRIDLDHQGIFRMSTKVGEQTLAWNKTWESWDFWSVFDWDFLHRIGQGPVAKCTHEVGFVWMGPKSQCVFFESVVSGLDAIHATQTEVLYTFTSGWGWMFRWLELETNPFHPFSSFWVRSICI